MAYKVLIRNRFKTDVQLVYNFLLHEWNKEIAERLITDLDFLLSVLTEQPGIGSPSSTVKDVRSISVTKHNRLFYRIAKNTVVILRLKDTRRKTYKK